MSQEIIPLFLIYFSIFFYIKLRTHVNGSQTSPSQQTQNTCSVTQVKNPLNGIKSSSKCSIPSSWNTNTNGRKLTCSETHSEKHDTSMVEKGIPVFAKPFKIPSQPDHHSFKNRPSNTMDFSTSHNHGGKDVESILKMMTSTLEPLTKIAATPRTDIDVQTPKKPYVYANLPPLLRASGQNCTDSMYFSINNV